MRILAGIFIVIAVAIPTVSHLIVKFVYWPRINVAHQRVERLTPKILADLKEVAQEPPFKETRFEHDAQFFLESYISWEGLDKVVRDADNVVDLFNRFTYWKTAPGQLRQLTEDPAFKNISTDWMESLYKFDHWNLAGRSEVAQKLQLAAQMNGIKRIGLFATLPIPNYNEIRLWATLHLLKKYGAGKILEGFHTFRQTAQLVHSSGTLVGNMIAVAMLKDEHMLAEMLKVSNWELVSMPAIEAYQRVSWAWVALSHEPWFREFPEEFAAYMRPQLGLCAAAWELNSSVSGFQDFLEPKVIFESDFAENMERSRKFQIQLLKTCNLSSVAAVVSSTPAGANPWFGKGYNELLVMDIPAGARDAASINWSRVPYLRRILGLTLLTVAAPNYLQLYERKGN